MLYNLPYAYSVLDGCEGDPALISRKLLDILDRRPPPPGTWSVIYLLFSASDERHLWFSSANAAGAVCEHLLETYRRENDLLKACSPGKSPAFDWRFELSRAAKAGVLELKRLPANSAAPATVEVIFRVLAGGVIPGTLHVVVRSQPVLEDGARLLAVSEAASPLVHVAHHVDRFQRGLRRGRPALYLTERWNQFMVGPHPACEFVCESLKRFWTVSFRAREGLWRMALIDGDGQGRGAGEQELSELTLLDEAVGVCVEGRALSPPPTFKAQLRENRVPLYDLTAVSRLLPLGPARGYGYVAEELRRSLDDTVRSCVRLSPDGPYLYLDEYEQVFSVDYGGATPRRIHSGDRVVLGDHLMTWQAFEEEAGGGELSSFFCGELVFEKPTTRRLASNGISVPLREAFGAHYDEFQGRTRLVSGDGLNFLLRFAEGTSAAPVWIKPGERKGFQLRTGGDAGWRFEDSPVEFVVGSTRFRLAAERDSD